LGEAAADKRALNWLFALVVIAVLLRLYVTESNRIYFDGCGYIMHAWSIAQGRLTTPYWMAGVDHYYPPLYPFAIFLFHLVIRNWVYAAKTVSILFSGLLFLPFYSLARRIFNREVALFSCAFLVAHPLLIEVGANAYSEPIFLFFIALAMLWGYRLLVEKKSWLALLSGIALGIANLGRAQALAGLLSMAAILFIWWISRQLSLGQFLRFAVLILAGFYLFAFPYDYYNYQKEGIWGLRLRMEFFKKGYRFGEDLEWFQRERTLNKDATSLLTFEMARTNSPFQFIREHPRVYGQWVRNDLLTILDREFSNHKIVSPVYSLSVLILLLVMVWQKQDLIRNPYAHFYLLFWFLPLLFLVPLAISVLDRYFLPWTFCFSIWAGCAFDFLRRKTGHYFSGQWFSRQIKFSEVGPWLLLILFLHPLPKEIYDKSRIVNYPRKESDWITTVTHGAQRKVIMSPDPFPALYTGNYWYMLPVDNINRTAKYARSQKADYLLADDLFFVWLKAPGDFIDQYLSPFAKPGLKYMGQVSTCFRNNGKKKFKRSALYQVETDDAPKQALPNIILVSIDTLRRDHLSAYGYHRETSPNIDRIAKAGARFDRVISQSPKTAPSHMTMFTSLYPQVHQVHKEYNTKTFVKLNPVWKTLPEILAANGYRTAAFTGGVQMSKGFGFERGFEKFEENMLRLNKQSFEPALKWLGSKKSGEPFFLFLHTYQVHDPYCPPRPFNKLYDPDYNGWIIDDWDELTRLADTRKFFPLHDVFWGGREKGVKGDELNLQLLDERDTQHMAALYDSSIRYTDEMFGRFFQELEKRGILGGENTMLIITSDHGEEFREHGDFLHKKLYRETMEVPLIIYWPGRVPAGKLVRGQFRLLDLAPTILDLAGITPHPQMQGVSLKDALSSADKIMLTAYSEDPFLRKDFAVRTDLFMSYTIENKSREEFFFELTDPKETINLLPLQREVEHQPNNIFSSYSDIQKLCRKRMDGFFVYNERHKNIFEVPKEQQETMTLSRKQMENLEALGYIK